MRLATSRARSTSLPTTAASVSVAVTRRWQSASAGRRERGGRAGELCERGGSSKVCDHAPFRERVRGSDEEAIGLVEVLADLLGEDQCVGEVPEALREATSIDTRIPVSGVRNSWEALATKAGELRFERCFQPIEKPVDKMLAEETQFVVRTVQ